jgi:para-aminobenzoate synthetase/4-amino-4-deoxychorismate lyase
MKALIYDSCHQFWLKFENPVQIFSVHSIEDILPVLQAIEESTRQINLHAIGFLSYEASSAFDTLFVTQPCDNKAFPLAFFALFKEPEILSDLASLQTGTIELSPFLSDTSKITYLNDLAQIKTHLRKGDIYQVNYSMRLRARYCGDPLSWFIAKAKEMPGNYLFYIEAEDFAIASLSPELFLEKNGSHLRSRPMKGTCKYRDGFALEDSIFLQNDPKNRAENLMIVDMIRNDMGRIAEMGSVTVPSLFDTETYPTVIQMTSTVCSSTGKSLSAILKALFPCASITGAPKIRSMEIIAALEKSPRGIYTGAIGHVKPDGVAKFNVAIRTAFFNTRTYQVEYGTGGGITWLSNPHEEWNECMTKAAVLGTSGDFYVLESLLLENGSFFLLEDHLNRLLNSCAFFNIATDPAIIKNTVQNRILTLAQELTTGNYKVRIMVKSETEYPLNTIC